MIKLVIFVALICGGAMGQYGRLEACQTLCGPYMNWPFRGRNVAQDASNLYFDTYEKLAQAGGGILLAGKPGAATEAGLNAATRLRGDIKGAFNKVFGIFG